MKTRNRSCFFVILAMAVSCVVFSVSHVAAVTPPAITFSDNTNEWITNVSFDDINNTTAAESTNGYGDYTFATCPATGQYADIVANATYTLGVTIKPATLPHGFISAFFDWNSDGDFNDAGEEVVVATDTNMAGPHTAEVTVPGDVGPGEVRMRVVLIYGITGTVPSSGSQTYGEAEDYSLWVPGPGVYKPIWGDPATEWITTVSFSGISINTFQENSGYGDYTFATYPYSGQYTDIAAGASYTLSVKIQASGAPHHISVFFDWNSNGLFSDPGEKFVVATGVAEAGPHTVEVSVPANAQPGEIRMRVVASEYSPVPSWGDIGSGEAEDYSLWLFGPGVYPPIWRDTLNELWIANVTFGDIDNNTGSNDHGYGDYTAATTGVTTDVIPGWTYPLSVTIYLGSYSSVHTYAIFDWNRNGGFADSGESIIIDRDALTSGTYTYNVTVIVPPGTKPGPVRMRVVACDNSITPSWGYIYLGEAEDYTVQVLKTFPWSMFLPAITNNAQP